MKVKALRIGYYDNRRWREGEVFELVTIKGAKKTITPEEQFSEKWMEKVEVAKKTEVVADAPSEAPKPKAKAKKRGKAKKETAVI